MSTSPARHAFSVEDLERMVASGILREDSRVELIEGEIVDMGPMGSRHAARVDRLTQVFVLLSGEKASVRVQSPVRLSTRSLPQPDLALLKYREDFYASGHPGPEDCLLVVEVADESVAYDREVKVPLYAWAGIAEVWLVVLPENLVEVYRHPSARGYRERIVYFPGDGLTLEGFGEVAVSYLLGTRR
ncbi:MAG: Uma2 family endonuclease [Thermoanaerobaculum sp.]